ADDNADAFAGRRPIGAGEERRERCDAARLRHDARGLPQCLLRLHDGLIGDEHDGRDMRLDDRKAALADPARRQRIRCDAAGFGVDRPAGSALVSVGAATGSTPTTLMRPRYQAAMPPISPPPPTATSSVSSAGACCSSSMASVPWPSMVSSWSNACTGMAPLCASHASLAASASA